MKRNLLSYCCLSILAMCMALAIGVPAGAAPVEWAGQEVTKDGRLHVKNPARGMEASSSLRLQEQWRAGGEDEDEDIFFGVLSSIDTDDDGMVYLLDSQLSEVFVYSPNGEYVRSIGREGEGPGEFRRASDVFFTATGHVAVLQRMPGKIILLTPGGDPAGNFEVQSEDDGVRFFASAARAGDGLVLQTQQFARRDTGFDITMELVRVDAEGKQTAKYTEYSQSRDFANMSFDEKTMGGMGMWEAGVDGRVYVTDSFDDYRITVYHTDGRIDRVIEREYEPRVRTDEEKERRVPRMRFRGRGGRGSEPEVKGSDTDRAIMAMFPRDDNTLWVINSRGAFDAPDGAIGTFDVFDADGRFVREVTLMGDGAFEDDGFHFVGDRLFVMRGLRSAQRAMFGGMEGAEYDEDEDAEPMAVICYELGQFAQGSN